MLLLSLYTHVAYNEINRQLFWSKKYKEKQTKYRYRKNIKMKSITIYAKGANKNKIYSRSKYKHTNGRDKYIAH